MAKIKLRLVPMIVLAGLTVIAGAAEPGGGRVVYLSDRLAELATGHKQGWGRLGLDTAAYADQTAMPLQIGDRVYKKGLGHHASGQLVVNLGGCYERFLADVGVQWQGGGKGSVRFKVFVDSKQRFASEVLSDSDAPQQISIPVEGAQVLRLVADDAGDGWNFDMANWVDARLVAAPGHLKQEKREYFDAAVFGRVVTFDPDQHGGVRSSRYDVFRADEVFLDAQLTPDAQGHYQMHRQQNGRACIGLQWVMPRTLRRLELELAEAADVPQVDQLRVQHWQGESFWQGQWRDVAGQIERDGSLLSVSCSPPISTRRVRWIFPTGSEPIRVARLAAITPARKQRGTFRLEATGARPAGRARLEVQNGRFMESDPAGHRGIAEGTYCEWDMSRPKQVTLEYNVPGELTGNQTVISLWLPGVGGRSPEKHALAVGVDDVLEHGYVYLAEYDVCVLRGDVDRSAAEIAAELAATFDVLEEVRRLPDQSFEQALKARVVKESLAPIMVGLACDNRKFVVERDGNVSFTIGPELGGVTLIGAQQRTFYPLHLRCRLLGANMSAPSRRLRGEWLPIPEVSINHEGMNFQQRTFVAPFGPANERAHEYLRQRPVCVTQIELRNSANQARKVAVEIELTVDPADAQQADSNVMGQRGRFTLDGRTLALCDASGASGLSLVKRGDKLIVEGKLAAGQEARCVVAVVCHLSDETLKQLEPLDGKQSDSLLKATEAYWRGILADGTRIEVPEKRLQHVIDASRVHCLLASRHEEQGDRFVAWGAAGFYGYMEGEANPIIRGMDMLGHHDFAQRALDFAIHHYTPEGVVRLPAHAYTPLIGTAWHLWAVGTHYELTVDREWLRLAAPRLAQPCRWIVRQTEKTKQLTPALEKVPEYGLVPPGVSADWHLFAYRYMMLSLYHAGLRDTAQALRDINYPDVGQFEQCAQELRKNIVRAYQWSQARIPAWPMSDGASAQAYPSSLFTIRTTRDIHHAADANRGLAYDVELGANHLGVLGLLDPQSPEMTSMLRHVENTWFLTGHGFLRSDYSAALNRAEWFNRGGFGKIQPYYGRFTQLHGLRDDIKPFLRSYYNALVYLLDLETLSLWEHALNVACWNKTHETGYFLQQTRMMLLGERGDELWVAPLTPTHWMQDGMRVSVEAAPTAFGPLSYEMTSHVREGYIEAQIDPPTRRPPRALIVRFRHPKETPIRSVTVNGQSHDDFAPERGCVRVPPSEASIKVRAYF